MTTRVLATYDFTLKQDDEEGNQTEDLKDFLKESCKKWAFQLELSDTGYLHYQGRFSLHKKTTLNQCKKIFIEQFPVIHIRPTCSTTCKNSKFDYVIKSQTRHEGPWTDQDKEEEVIHVPIQYKVEFREWQTELYDLVMKEIDDKIYRNVHVLYDQGGGIGKTTFAMSLTCKRKAEYIPPCNDSRDIMRMAYCLPDTKLYIFDLTRSMNKDRLHGMYSAIEQIKNGYIYDDRYTFKRRFIDAPAVIIMTNELPSQSYLSQDRWKLHTVEDGKLIHLNVDEDEDHDHGLDD